MIEHSTRKHWCQHIKPVALQHTRSYHPSPQQDLDIFNLKILFCKKKLTLFQEINYGYFTTWPGLTAKLISKYITESEITSKGHIYQQKQRALAADAANVTHLSTKEVDNKNETIIQLFDQNKKYSDLTRKFPVQSNIGNNCILVA